MILYTKRFYGLSLLLQMFGSAIPRALPFALAGGIVAFVLRVYCSEYLDHTWKHPFPFQSISFIAGFLVTFRANLGYQRYWEGCTNLRLMSQRLADAVVQVVTFDVGALPEDASEETLTEAAVFRDTYLHITSLLHATALQSLCKNEDTRNFIMHNSLHQTPKEDAREQELHDVHAQHMGMASWQDLFVLRGRAAVPMPHRREKQRVVLPVLGGVCNEENVALGALDMTANPYFKDHAEFQGFLLHNGMFAPRSASRVQTVMTWLQQCIMERRREGGLQVPAPLLTRMYQLLSDGMLGYEQCRKLARIPFPFPHAQMVTATLLLFTLTLPVMIAAFIKSPAMAALLSAMTQVLYWGTHEVARELEDPFLIWSTTYNCLPFSSIQWSFNEDILAFAYSVKPPEATRANGLFPSLSNRIPVRRYTKPGASAVAAGTVTHPPADSHLPGLATLSRLASIAPPGAPGRVSFMSSSSFSANTGGASNPPSEASFSAFIDGRRGREASPQRRSASAAQGITRVSSRGRLTRAMSANSAPGVASMAAEAYAASSATHGDHAYVTGTSAPAATQAWPSAGAGVSTGEAAAPAMAGATVAEAHSATADGVHRGAVSSRGNVRFSEQEPSTSQIQVDMDDMNDVPGMHSMHDRDEHMHESLLASSGGREASFGGSLRTPLSRVSKVRSVDGHGSVGAGDILIEGDERAGNDWGDSDAFAGFSNRKIEEDLDTEEAGDGATDVNKPLLS